jgi:hypothetical protein
MSMKKTLLTQAVALALLAPAAATIATSAQAQAVRRDVTPQVSALQLNADYGISPGSTLRFTVQGTPGGRATVGLGRSDIVVPLREAQPGVYRGAYTVRGSDRIDPTAILQARIARSGLTTVHNFTYPPSFQALASGGPQVAQGPAAPFIERFAVRPAGRLEPGADNRLRVSGAPGGQASVDIPGVARDIPLAETSPGRYEGVYTVRNRDNPEAFNVAVATLRSGNQWVTSRIERAFEVTQREVIPPQPTVIMGAAPATLGVTLMTGANTTADVNGNVPISGRTAPNAQVRIDVNAIPPSAAGRTAVAQDVFNQTVQADANGNFNVLVQPRFQPAPGTRYDVRVEALGNGGQRAESRVTLYPRG